MREVVLVESKIKYKGEVINKKHTRHALAPGTTCLNTCLEIDNPELWWPNGYGDQPLYQAEVRVISQDKEQLSDSTEVNFGIRRIEMVRNETKDQRALPYTFKVNGRKIYIKGWNWVPIDVMYGIERPAKLKRLLNLVRKANVNMLRVWGGGLIEKDSFYELCNRYGIMVWQEFIQSSSGIENKPTEDPDFIAMMVKEAEGIIPRKRNHPSLVLWCGGNELQDEKEKPLDNEEPVLKALQQVVKKLDPDRYWLPTSPTGRFFGNTLENIEKDPLGLHDVHGPWEYQGLVEQYTLYNRSTSLLHSEFGVEGLTNLRTLQKTISRENQWPAVKENPIYFHLGAWWVNEPLVQKAFGGVDRVDDLVKASQFLQLEGLRYAVEANRRRKYQNSGALPWQFNEPYPNAFCTCAIDYYARPKAVYYGIKKAYRPLHVSARFDRQVWGDLKKFTASIYGHNSLDNDLKSELKVKIQDSKGNLYYEKIEKIKLTSNRATFLLDTEVRIEDLETELFFLKLELITEDGIRVDNSYLFSTTLNLAPMFSLGETSLDVKEKRVGDQWELSIRNKGQEAALLISFEDKLELRTRGYAYFSDNHFTLLPGEEKMVKVEWDEVPPKNRGLKLAGWNTETIIIK